jgi:hypothetical protein
VDIPGKSKSPAAQHHQTDLPEKKPTNRTSGPRGMILVKPNK